MSITSNAKTGKSKDGWTSAPKTNIGLSLNESAYDISRQLLVLAQFLKAGLHVDETAIAQYQEELRQQQISDWPWVYDRQAHTLPTKANAYAHLNIFGAPRDEEGEMYHDQESRQRVFEMRFKAAVEKGAEGAKKAGGEVGRAGAVLAKVLLEGSNGDEI